MVGLLSLRRNVSRLLLGLSLLGLAVYVYALFMPFLGPALDHHFAERQPRHLHISATSATGVPLQHAHPYQLPHAHELGTEPLARQAGVVAPQGWTIFLRPDGDSVTDPAGVSFTPLLLSATVLLLIPSVLALLQAFGWPTLVGWVPRLESPPPRPAL